MLQFAIQNSSATGCLGMFVVVIYREVSFAAINWKYFLDIAQILKKCNFVPNLFLLGAYPISTYVLTVIGSPGIMPCLESSTDVSTLFLYS